MKAKDKTVRAVPNLLNDLQRIFTGALLVPVDVLPVDRSSIKILEKAGIKFIGDLIQRPEEKITIPLKERKKIREWLARENLIWDCNLSPFLKYIYQCAKAYFWLKPEYGKQDVRLLIALLLSDSGDFHIKDLSFFSLPRSKRPEKELSDKINEITRQLFSRMFKKI